MKFRIFSIILAVVTLVGVSIVGQVSNEKEELISKRNQTTKIDKLV
ncbi:hypothetical protein [Bacillus gobiensis]